MEFFARARIKLPVADLQRQIRIDNLSEWCDGIDRVSAHSGERGSIECLWGECSIHREVIRSGLRFSLPGTAQAIQWTLTTDVPAHPGVVLVHGTATAPEDAILAEEMAVFIAAWERGLEHGLAQLKADRAARSAAACSPCVNWFN